MHRHSGHSLSNTPIGDNDWKAIRPWSEVFCVYVCLCMSFTVTLTYQCHWFVHLSDEIFVAVIWFAIPETAIRRVTDGIYMCSMSSGLELDSLLWSWKATSKIWSILINSERSWLKLKPDKNHMPSISLHFQQKNLLWMIEVKLYSSVVGTGGATPACTLMSYKCVLKTCESPQTLNPALTAETRAPS